MAAANVLLSPREVVLLADLEAILRAERAAVRALPVIQTATAERERIAASLDYGVLELGRIVRRQA